MAIQGYVGPVGGHGQRTYEHQVYSNQVRNRIEVSRHIESILSRVKSKAAMWEATEATKKLPYIMVSRLDVRNLIEALEHAVQLIGSEATEISKLANMNQMERNSNARRGPYIP